ADDDALVREPVPAERETHRPQRHERIEVLRGDLEPAGAPLAERLADLEQVVARARELVAVTAALGLRCRLDDAEAFEVLEPLGEQGTGEPGRAREDLAERLAAQLQIADDQRRPSLGEQLRAAGDRAVLTIGPHESASTPTPPPPVRPHGGCVPATGTSATASAPRCTSSATPARRWTPTPPGCSTRS